jgi:hypothetical protein
MTNTMTMEGSDAEYWKQELLLQTLFNVSSAGTIRNLKIADDDKNSVIVSWVIAI